LVATNDAHALEPLQQPARASPKRLERELAGLRPRPEFPLDAGVIDPKPSVHEEAYSHKREKGGCKPSLSGADEDEGAEQQRNADVVGIALLQAERTRPIAADMLEPERRQDDRHCRQERSGAPSVGWISLGNGQRRWHDSHEIAKGNEPTE